jgi:hypothetical protein
MERSGMIIMPSFSCPKEHALIDINLNFQAWSCNLEVHKNRAPIATFI